MDQNELRELENRCIQEQPPACAAACPVHLDARAVMAEVARGDFTAAAKILKKSIPFPGIISRICDHPCQAACRRGDAGDPVSIRAIERACLDHAGEFSEKSLPLPGRDGRAAIIGGGLSGLTAAFDLARKGYSVVVFEQAPQLGGSLGMFPEEILPSHVIARDLEVLAQVGIDIRLGVEVGTDISPETIFSEFDAVYLAMGADFNNSFELPLNSAGLLPVHPVTFATGREKIFAGGGMTRNESERSPIQSIADGRRAAISMDRYLQKVSLTASRMDAGSHSTRLYTRTEGLVPSAAVVPENTSQGYSDEEAVREARRCIQCQCLECVKVCEYLNSFGGYPKQYVRQIYNNLSIVMGHRHANKLINSCSLCGLCREVCPEDLHMGMVCRKARELMVEQGRMPPSAHDFPLRDMAFSNSEKCTLIRHQPRTQRSRFLFFPGCQLSGSSPDHVRKAYETLTEKLTGGVGLMLRCCGAPADWSGRTEAFQDILEAFSAEWRRMEEPEVILACSTCYEIFKTHLPDVSILSLWELLDRFDLLPASGLEQGRSVAVHDACATRHEHHIHESVRSILKKCGLQVEELPLSRDKTECCGFGGLMFFANPELAKRSIERRAAESSADYVAYCAMCRDYLASRGKRTLHLLDLFFGASMDAAAEKRGPGYSQRQENRVRLKSALLKEVWRESPAPKEDYEKIQLNVSDHVRELMEARMILEDDIRRVIAHAENTGNRLSDSKTGRFLAHHKPDSVTYWVEYSRIEDTFVIHNTYSHRMEIVEDAKP
ncbi:hypothetical protein DSTSK_05600 [Desulforhabdus sp. TSK]|nr:hypothetical protein DSTSK_05600 [Desulforhabdus sp. TSK]